MLPMTFSLWRRVALKHLRELKPSHFDYYQFAVEVDLTLLEQYRSKVCQRYKAVIIKEDKYLPEQFKGLGESK